MYPTSKQNLNLAISVLSSSYSIWLGSAARAILAGFLRAIIIINKTIEVPLCRLPKDSVGQMRVILQQENGVASELSLTGYFSLALWCALFVRSC